MNVKLTLNLEKDVIEKAKSYARLKNQSLSALVKNYFNFISESSKINEIEISQNIKELSGVIRLNDEYDHKKEYKKHLLEKYS